MTRIACLIGMAFALLLVSGAHQGTEPRPVIDSTDRLSWTAAGRNNNLGNGESCNGRDGQDGTDGPNGAKGGDGGNGGNCGSNNNDSG